MKTFFTILLLAAAALFFFRRRKKNLEQQLAADVDDLNRVGDIKRDIDLAMEPPVAMVGQRPWSGIPLWSPNTNPGCFTPRDTVLLPRFFEDNPYQVNVPYRN